MSVKLVRVNTSGHANEAFDCDDADDGLAASAQEKTKNAEPDLPPVSFLALFRFASVTDRFLLIAAVLASAINGLCFPFLVILMGDLTNAFVSGGINQTLLDAAYCNESALPPDFNET